MSALASQCAQHCSDEKKSCWCSGVVILGLVQAWYLHRKCRKMQDNRPQDLIHVRLAHQDSHTNHQICRRLFLTSPEGHGERYCTFAKNGVIWNYKASVERKKWKYYNTIYEIQMSFNVLYVSKTISLLFLLSIYVLVHVLIHYSSGLMKMKPEHVQCEKLMLHKAYPCYFHWVWNWCLRYPWCYRGSDKPWPHECVVTHKTGILESWH